MDRHAVRTTAGKVNRSEELTGDEKAVAAAILRENPSLGNPHVVRCGFCGTTRTLFRDESDAPLKRSGHGWRCEACNVGAGSQEVKF